MRKPHHVTTHPQAGRTKDPEAHDLYLRGLASAHAASEADLRRALEFYQQSLRMAPLVDRVEVQTI